VFNVSGGGGGGGGGAGAPTAALTVSPTQGPSSTNFVFDAAGSQAGAAAIAEYVFIFGDNTPNVTSRTPTAQHRYAAPNTYTARVTVIDTAGLTGTATVSVTVQ
jgi:PKD repeat protein